MSVTLSQQLAVNISKTVDILTTNILPCLLSSDGLDCFTNLIQYNHQLRLYSDEEEVSEPMMRHRITVQQGRNHRNNHILYYDNQHRYHQVLQLDTWGPLLAGCLVLSVW